MTTPKVAPLTSVILIILNIDVINNNPKIIEEIFLFKEIYLLF